MGTSLVGQWLRLHAFSAGGVGSIPGRGTKIPHAVWPKKKKKISQMYVEIIRRTVIPILMTVK